MEIEQSVSFYQVAQQKVDHYLQHINLTSRDIICYVSIFGIGFLIGSLFKRYGTIIVSWLIGIVLLFAICQYFDLIVIQKTNIKLLLHIEHVHSLDDLMIEIKTQMHHFWLESFICCGSILLGFKLG